MSQNIATGIALQNEQFVLPDHDVEVMPGVAWGHYYATFTPAFWATQAWLDREDKIYSNFRIGDTLREEVAACLLGGYGIPAEVGLEAYYRVRDSGLLSGRSPSMETLYEMLSRPLLVNERPVRYRFAAQRSRYLSEALAILECEQPPAHDDRAFRQWLSCSSGHLVMLAALEPGFGFCE